MTWVLLWYNNVNAVYDEISWVLVIKIAINILFKKGCMQNFGKRTVQNHYDYMWNVHRKHTKQRVCVCVCVCVCQLVQLRLTFYSCELEELKSRT